MKSGASVPAGGMSVGRRAFLRGALSTAALGAALGISGSSLLAGCSIQPNSQVPTTSGIQLWHLFTGGDGGVFSRMMDLVQQQDPSIAIDPVVLTWGGPYYTKLAMASVGGRAPDLAVMHATRLAGYAPGGLLDGWDLDRLAQAGIDINRFPEALINRCRVGDTLYGIPLDFHAFVMLYNKDICADAGVLNDDGTLALEPGEEGFHNLATTLSNHLGAPAISYGYTGDGAQMSRMFWSLYAQIGAACELVPGREAVFDLDAAAKVIEWGQSTFNDEVGVKNLDYGGGVASFSTGRSALNFNGNWEIPAFEGAGLNLGVQVMPQIFDHPATFGDSHVFVLPHQTSVDEDARDTAYAVVAGMLSNSLDWAKGGHIPSSDEVTQSAEYLAMHPYCDYVEAKEIAVFEPSAWFTGSGSDFQARLGEVVQDAWLGGTDPHACAQALKDRLDAFLAMEPPA